MLRFIGNIKLKAENKTLIVGNLTLDQLNRAKCLLIKGALEGLRQFLATESPLKMMKNAFYFT